MIDKALELKTLTLQQLEEIPWNRKYVSGPMVPAEPEVGQIHELVRVPFMKRDPLYNLFYCWVETIDLVGDSDHLKILDTCCGRGQVAQVLAMKGHEVKGCDAADYFSADNKLIQFKQTDLNSTFPYNDKCVDVVLNVSGLEYLNDTDHFIKESARILKNGGRLIISIPNIQSISSIIGFLKTGCLSGYSRDTLPARKNLMYLPLLITQLERWGFRVCRIRGNVPQLNVKIKIFSDFFSSFMFYRGDDILQYAHALVLEAVLSECKE